jgi:WD40 repeat protein
MLLMLIFAAAPPIEPLPPGAIARLGSDRLRDGAVLYGLAYSPDGSLIASTGLLAPRRINLWCARTGRLVKSLGEGLEPEHLAFSPDGKLIAANVGMDLAVWRVADGRMIYRQRGHTQNITLLAWSPDGKWIASGAGKEVRLWEARTGRLAQRLKEIHPYASALGFRWDGKALVTGAGDGELVAWSVPGFDELWKARAEGAGPRQILSAGKGQPLHVVSGQGEVFLWDGQSGKQTGQVAVDGQVLYLDASRGGALAAGCFDGHVAILTGGKVVARWRATPTFICRAVLSPDGRRVATFGHYRSRIDLWDAATGKALLPREGNESMVTALTVPAGSQEAVSLGWALDAVRWPLRGGPALKRQIHHPAFGFAITALSPDGSLCAVAHRYPGNFVALHDTATGAPLRLLPNPDFVTRLAFSPNGSHLLGTCHDGPLLAWDLRTGRNATPGDSHLKNIGYIHHLTVSADGKLAYVAAEFGIYTFEIATGKRLRSLPINGTCRGLATSPTSPIVAATVDNPQGHLLLWNPLRDEVIGVWEMDAPSLLAFSPDGRRLAMSIEDDPAHVRVLDVRTGATLLEWKSRNRRTSALAWAPDGRVLFSGGATGAVTAWDATGLLGQPLRLDDAALERAWRQLGGRAAEAHAAAWRLADAPGGVDFLARKLRPARPLDDADLNRLLAALDSDDVDIRNGSEEKLRALGPAVAAPLRRHLEAKPSLEVKRRIERLLREAAESPEALRQSRAVMALECSRSPEARTLLKKLAAGEAGSPLTDDARSALARRATRKE